MIRRNIKGFTLIELLVVIVIIMVLVGTLMPTILRVRVQILSNLTQATINSVHVAVQMYRTDMKALPGSDLVQAVTGYRSDDGVDGYGMRAKNAKVGRVFGPYAGTEKLRFTGSGTGVSTFVDAFDRPILYYWAERVPAATGQPEKYKFNSETNNKPWTDEKFPEMTVKVSGSLSKTGLNVLLTQADADLVNSSNVAAGMLANVEDKGASGSKRSYKLTILRGPLSTGGDGTNGDIADYVTKTPGNTTTSPVYYRTDFVLISGGPDGALAGMRRNSRTDDVTNFNN